MSETRRLEPLDGWGRISRLWGWNARSSLAGALVAPMPPVLRLAALVGLIQLAVL